MVNVYEIAQFDTEAEAEAAYFQGGDGRDGSGVDQRPFGDGWAEPTVMDLLAGNWVLMRQQQAVTLGDGRRWFVVDGPTNAIEFMESGGRTEIPPEDVSYDEVPSFDTEEAARQAHANWLGENPEYGDGEVEDGPGWSEWAEIDEAPPWFVYAREEIEGEAIEAVIAGVNSDGSTAYLAPNVEILDEPFIYPDFRAVEDALAAYFAAADNGDVPEDRQPTGAPPGVDVITDATPDPPGSGPGGIVPSMVGAAARNPLLVVAVIVIAYMLYRRYQASDGAVDVPEVDTGGGPEL